MRPASPPTNPVRPTSRTAGDAGKTSRRVALASTSGRATWATATPTAQTGTAARRGIVASKDLSRTCLLAGEDDWSAGPTLPAPAELVHVVPGRLWPVSIPARNPRQPGSSPRPSVRASTRNNRTATEARVRRRTTGPDAGPCPAHCNHRAAGPSCAVHQGDPRSSPAVHDAHPRPDRYVVLRVGST
jgi:hypothetical protein